MQRWLRMWTEVDWNWREFGRWEWVQICFSGVFLVIIVGWLIRPSWDGSPLFLISVFYLPRSLQRFAAANLERRGVTEPQPRQSHPPRQITDRTLRTMLGGGFVVLLVMLGLILLIAR